MAAKKKTKARPKRKAAPKVKPKVEKLTRFDGPPEVSWERQWKPMEGGVHTEHLTDTQQAAVIDVLRDLMAASMRHAPGCVCACEPGDCECPYIGDDMVLHVVGTLGNMRLVHAQAKAFSEEVEKATGKKVTVRRKTSRQKAAKKSKKA